MKARRMKETNVQFNAKNVETVKISRMHTGWKVRGC